MNAPLHKTAYLAAAQDNVADLIAAACDTIAPTWPLDRMIAVNPYWGRIGQSFDQVNQTLTSLGGSSLYMPLDYYRAAWRQQQITASDLQAALAERQSSRPLQALIDALAAPEQPITPAPLLCDSLDQQRDLQHEPAWCDTITHQVAQFCAAYFDTDQAEWRPDQQVALYQSWRDVMIKDHSVTALMKNAQVRQRAAQLAAEPEQQIAVALETLAVPFDQRAAFLQAVLLRISGWASWCAYRRWQARLAGADDNALMNLLAIRLAWECLIDDGQRNETSVWQRWRDSWEQHLASIDHSAMDVRAIWQRAHEIHYQRDLAQRLLSASADSTAVSQAVRLQAVFCIDVRSEVLRRQFETVATDVQTLGFAGFFGLPISYAPLGTSAPRPQLPGLLAPALQVTDSSGDAQLDQAIALRRQQALAKITAVRPFQSLPASAFTLVETLGLGYVGKLLKRSLGRSATVTADDQLGLSMADACAVSPTLSAAAAGGIDGMADLAGRILNAMNLTANFARLVLLLGHGSQSENNPQKAGLDCGACCGQTGAVNARALAGLLNNPDVRTRLAGQGIQIPASTRFVAGLHNTTTDDVTLFDLAALPDSHRADVAYAQDRLALAGQQARAERAPALGLAATAGNPDVLAKAVRKRASDWAQTRPEWGLANNACFVVGSRARTRGINLEGRSFLHEYDHQQDKDGSVLELIMTAPMVVTHWINMQYHASTVDPRRYGSGNKVLHNVVGGRIGVFEGNGGDLRVGLALQSVHDGQQWRHTPLRLTVVIEAPRESIQRIIAKHPTVRQLLDHQWLYLMRLEQGRLESYRNGQWLPWQQD